MLFRSRERLVTIREDRDRSGRDRHGTRQYDSSGDLRNTQRQASKSRNRRSTRSPSSDSHSDEEWEPVGSLCFTRRIRESKMPKRFRLTSETPKFDDSQEPSSWLEDYKMAVSCQRGSTTTAMQYIQLMLSRTARDWLKSLPEGSYDSWERFQEDFIKKFLATCDRPAT